VPDLRTNQAVAERLDLQLERWSNPLLRQRRWATLAAGILPLIILAVFAARQNQTIFWSRSLSTGHHLIEHDCQKCHQSRWQPLARLSKLDNTVRSVRDEDCRSCHHQRGDDHGQLPDTVQAPACAACHCEHRGVTHLSNVADAFCIRCHGSQAPTAIRREVVDIDSFQTHPEFAVHRLNQRDDTALKFSHSGHLRPLLVPWDERGDDAATVRKRQLTCHDCHQLDSSGEYLRPVTYEEHCATCHPLRFSAKTAAHEPLPHATPEIVHGVLRDRLMAYAREHRDEVSGESAAGPPRLPNKQPRHGDAQDEWTWVEEELRVVESEVFHNPIKNGCLKCHIEAASETRPESSLGFAVVPTKIPTRWLPNSRFRHDRHATLACVVCHHTPDAKGDVLRPTGSPIRFDSDSVQDCLIPSLDICRACHGGQGATRSAGRARGDCVECHRYHHRDEAASVPGQLLFELLPAGGVLRGSSQ